MLEVVAEALFRVLTIMVGHGVLWVLTLGQWRAFDGRDDAATVAGLLFWAALLVGVWLVFLR